MRFPIRIFAAIVGFSLIGLIDELRAQFTNATDVGANYGGAGEPTFSNGQNGGSGFNAWSISTGGNAGTFIGNPGAAGITGMSTESFGLFANPHNSGNNFVNADRNFTTAMGVGDRYSFQWGVNWDTGGGTKGFNILVGGSQLINVNMGASETITINGTNTTFGYGTTNMTWSFFYSSPTTLVVTANDRDGNGTYSNNFAVTGGIDSMRWYANNMANNTERQPYFNNLLSTNSGVFTQGGTVTNNNTFSGSGNLSVGNSTTLALGGNVTYTGTTTISNNSTLRLQNSSTVNFASALSGDGALVISNGTGQVNLSGAGTGFTGAITVANGQLEAQTTNALGATNGGTTVSSGGALRLWNNSGGVTYAAEALTLNGFGTNSLNGALRNITNNNVWQGNITYGSGARINSDSGTLTISGTLTGGTNNMYFGGAGNVTLSNTVTGTQTGGDGAIYKDGAGNLTLLADNSGLSGLVRVLGGTVTVGSAGNLGTGTVEIGGTGTLSTTSNLTRTAGLLVTDGTNNASVVSVATNTTFTQTGAFTGAANAGTKIGKAGAGDLIFNAASGSTFNGQVQIGDGRVIIGVTGAMGTNASTGNRGIDLGLNVGDTSTTNNVSLLASNGVTVGQSIYVAGNSGSAVRTIGLSGNGTNTFNNEIFLGGPTNAPVTANLTVDTGSNSGNLVNLTGAISGAGGVGNGSVITVGGSGTVALSSTAGTTDGRWVVNSGATLAIGNLRNLGELAGGYYANKITMSGGTLRLTNSTSLTNVGIQFSGNSTISVDSGITATNPAVMGGSGNFTKSGTGTLVLTANNTNAGTTTVSAGTLIFNGTNTFTATTVTNAGSVLMGSGRLGSVTIIGGGTINPGNSPGTLTVGDVTFGGGGNYNWQIFNANGTTAGTDYDLMAGTSLNITADANNKFNINLWSLSSISPNDVNGNATNFSSSTPYTWTIGRFTGGITNFSTNFFAINTNAVNGTSGFSNTTAGAFAITTNSVGGTNQLVLTYTPTAVDYSVTVSSGSANQGAGSGIAGGTNQFTGAVGLNKLGAGTLVMTNAANNYTGTTTVQEGTISITVNAPSGSAGALGSNSSAVVIGLATNAVAAGFDIGAANVTNSRDLSIVAGNAAGGTRTVSMGATGTGVQAGAVAMGTNTLFSAASGGTLDVTGIISGSGAVTIGGAGTTVFSAANTFTNTTTITNGATLRIGNSSALGTTAGGTTVNSGATLAFSNNFSSAEAITISGTGVGNGGALRNLSGANTNSGLVTLGANSTIASDSGTLTLSGGINAANFTVTVGSSGNVVISSAITNSTAGLTKEGSGTLTLGAANTYTGLTTVNGGKIMMGASGGIQGDLSVGASGTFDLDNTPESLGSITGAGSIILGSGALTTSNSASTTFSGGISGTGSFIKVGAGTLTLSGTNSYSGQTYLVGGRTLFSTNQAATFTNTIHLGETNGTSTATLALTNTTTLVNPVTVRSGSSGAKTFESLSTSGTNTLSGAIVLNDNIVFNATNGGTLVLSGSISGGSAMTKNGEGTVILSGSSSNSYSGTTTVNAGVLVLQKSQGVNALAGTPTINSGGTLRLGASDQFQGDTTFLTINSGGTFDLNGFNDSLALTGAGNITLGSGRLTINPGLTDTFSGGISGTGSVVKTNVGTQIFTGSNSYTGGTLVGLGTLQIGSGGTTGSVAGNITNNAALVFNRSDALAHTGVISGTGTLTKQGGGNLTLSGANTYSGLTTHSSGGIIIGNNSALGTGVYQVDPAGSGQVIAASGTNNYTLSQSNNIYNNLTIGESTGNTGMLTFTGGSFLGNEANDVRILTVVGTHEFSGGITGARGLVKNGSGTLILSGANTFAGGSYLVNGTTTLSGNTGAGSGNLFLGETNGTTAATLAIGASGVTVTNAINVRSGSSGIMTIAALNTNGTATFSGTTTLNRAVTVAANSGGNLSLGAVAMGVDNLTYTGSNNVTIGGSMTATTGAAELRVNGTGTLTLSGNNSTGNFMKIILNNGALSVNSLNAFGTAGSFYGDKINFNGGSLQVTEDITIAASTFGMTTSGNGGTIDVASGRTFTQNAFVGGNAAGTFNKTGVGTLVLGDTANTFNPTFNIKAGVVQVTNISALGTNVTTIGLGDTNTAGTLRYMGGSATFNDNLVVGAGGGTIDVATAGLATTLTNSGTISGTGTLTKAGDSILVLSGANNYGKTAISGGMLTVQADSGLGATPGSATADSITIGNGRLGLNGNFTVGANRGITLTDVNSTIDVYGGNTAAVAGAITNTGAGSLTKLGTGTLELTGANTYTGNTAVGAGVLRVQGANGLGTGVVTVSNGATLELTNAAGMNFARNLTLSGSGTVSGALLSVGGANTNSGGITLASNSTIGVKAGSLVVSGDVANAGNTLTLDTYGVEGTPLTVSGAVSGNGGLTKIGGGRAVLSGSNSFAGGVNLNAGQLRLDSANALGTGTLTQSSGASTLEVNTTGTITNQMSIYNVNTLQTVALSGNKTLNNATYDVASGTTTTESGTLSGTGGITKNGAGTLVVSGSSPNTFTGTSSVSAGILQLQKSTTNAISGSSIAVNSGGTLLLGAANQIGNSTALIMAGGTLAINGQTDTVGRLTVSGGSTSESIFDFGSTVNGTPTTFTFSDFDTAAYGGATLRINNVATGTSIIFNTDYSGNNLFDKNAVGFSENSFASKIQFGGTGQFGQISFGGGQTTLLVAIPDARVYSAAVALIFLIGIAEVRRRRNQPGRGAGGRRED